ncbi:MAG: peptidoglycan DD-metalloendopeptidase family protein [Proteobacteria bacterium]|jgi:lipoprotein NlpD|nr:peptidoglycan DD-metalloendopeptidase family protein [Pseudomonadota bacterium]MCG6934284.1 peptidoglycan DD-metalloendopeptidase family protein [Pseudomonadota bacterium]
MRVRNTAITLLLVTLGLGTGCTRFVDPGKGYTRGTSHKPPPNTEVTWYTVGRGDTLYSIAWQYGYDYRAMAEWNNIPRPYTIYPGQKLLVRAPGPESSSRRPSTRVKSQSTQKRTTKQVPVQSAASPKKWTWPARGKIVSEFSAGDRRRQGIDIAGKRNDPVYAAASGRVVYSGNGLRGYGNLVIIKHNETYFSAYAHNQKVRVKENEKVKSGQRIADMGNTSADRVMLHFEIRRDGKPVNPMKYLPKQGS